MKKAACILSLAFLALSLQPYISEAAKSDTIAQPAAQNQASRRPDSQQANGAVVPAPSTFEESFIGSIDDKYPIRLELTRKDADLTGFYFYERGPLREGEVRKLLSLQGRIDADGNVTLTETSYDTANPQETGEFRGKLDGVSANGDVTLRFSGSWTRRKDGRQMPFSLRQFLFDLGGLRFNKKKEESANRKLCYKVNTEAPQLVGGNAALTEPFNKAVADFVAESVSSSIKIAGRDRPYRSQGAKSTAPTCTMDLTLEAGAVGPYNLSVSYGVIEANKDFVSIQFYYIENYNFTNFKLYDKSFNYDLNRKAAVKLADLFIPKSNYLKVISDYSIKELKKQKKLKTKSSVEKGAGPKIGNFHCWNITPAGLWITFDPGQLGINTGFNYVTIPYSVLKPIIRPDGLLAGLAK